MQRKPNRSPNGGLVYSTEGGTMCPECRKPIAACSCKTPALPKGDGVVRILLDTRQRGGKAVTVISGLLLGADALAAMGKSLKAACGSGGTTKDGVIEIQGDHRARVAERLRVDGYTVRLT